MTIFSALKTIYNETIILCNLFCFLTDLHTC
jgi:hypothetical protein